MVESRGYAASKMLSSETWWQALNRKPENTSTFRMLSKVEQIYSGPPFWQRISEVHSGSFRCKRRYTSVASFPELPRLLLICAYKSAEIHVLLWQYQD